MTDQAALAYEPERAAGRGRGTGRLAEIAAIGVVTLLALAAGVGIALLIATPSVAPETEAGGETAATTTPAAYAAAGSVLLMPIDPVITNIAAPPSAVVRLEASLVLKADVADAELLAAQIGADTLAFMRSMELAQMEGARGLLHLREDLKERAVLRSPDVVDLVIHSLVAQ